MKWTRHEYIDLMTFGPGAGGGRPWFSELFGPLIGLEEEWRAQGATQDELDMVGFDWDYVPYVPCGGATGMFGGPPRQLLHEDENERIERDGLGRTMRLCKKVATIALPMDFPVKTMDDWLRIKPLYTYDDARIDWKQVHLAKAAQTQGTLVRAAIPGAFHLAREFMGEEVACLAYYDQPEMMADIMQTVGDTAFQVLARISDELTIDHLAVHEDFAGRSGPLVGPAQIQQYFKPYYRMMWELLSSRGAKVFSLDTDGNINSVMDDLLDCGLTAIYPMEPAAGMDIVALRKKYGRRLAMLGGIDKFVLRKDKAAIRAELEYKLQPSMRQSGGLVFGLDHRIPNGTPLDNYRYYVALGREILGLPPLSPQHKGWGRMAF